MSMSSAEILVPYAQSANVYKATRNASYRVLTHNPLVLLVSADTQIAKLKIDINVAIVTSRSSL
jgi:hypothetical protein